MKNNLQSGITDPTSVLRLLRDWEQKQEEGYEAAWRFNRFLPEAKAMLEAVSAHVDRGQCYVRGWNVFDVLGRVRIEDAHSDMLAWLLSPWEAHGLGAGFLQEFAKVATGRSLPNYRVRAVETRKKINRNGDKIDIEVQGDRWVLAVENKIDHVEGIDQTQRYADHYELVCKMGVEFFGVFLTLSGEDAKAASYFHPMSYGKLRQLLDQLVTCSDAGAMVNWFSDHIRDELEIRQ